MKGIRFVGLKRNPKRDARRVFWLINQHNNLCLMLERFGNFWKILLIFIFSYYVLLIWFAVFVSVIYSHLDTLTRLMMLLVLGEVIGIYLCITIVIFNVSSEVLSLYFLLINKIIYFRQNHFIQS